MRRAVNIDDLPEGTPVDHYGFPTLPPAPVETEPGSTLAEMTNDFIHVKGKFWMRSPRLKQQKSLVKLQAKIQGIADPSAILEVYTEMVGLFLFVEEQEDYRFALPDEIEDHFDLAEVVEITRQMTGMKLQGEDDGPKKLVAPDWGFIFCMIADRFGWTFDEIGELSYPQIMAYERYIEQIPAPYAMMVSKKEE